MAIARSRQPPVPPQTEAQRVDPNFVTAVARAFAILRCYRRGERALGNKELATRTGLPRSTIARLTHTLTELGYLERLPALEKYALGIAVVGFGQTFLSALDLRQTARPFMQELANAVKASVALAARSGEGMMFLELAHGNPTFALGVAVGERVPRGTSALGRACAAGLPPETREQRILEFSRTVRAEDWPAALRGFREAFADYEKYGFCFSLGDWNKEVYAVSVPLVSNDPNKVLAFSCSLPARGVTREHLIRDIGPRLRDMRDRVHRALGGVF
ncbi:IclR family transcriptional regulator [Piscinibacter sp.]|jgi:DNA-binding IclR family transcriptional regulator|uniref:IclR family transcriptional regulator n=1 Tax=Piscinibacter sp. TaxID=1903157 RepID=UPI002F3EE161